MQSRSAMMLLMNTSISQEISVLVNSLLSQCKIIMTMFELYKLYLNIINLSMPQDFTSKVIEIQQEMSLGLSNMHCSLGNLLVYQSDILGYAQIQDGTFVKECKPLNLHRVVIDVLSLMKYQAELKNLKIETEYIGFPVKNQIAASVPDQELPLDRANLQIESDERMIRTVLVNLT